MDNKKFLQVYWQKGKSLNREVQQLPEEKEVAVTREKGGCQRSDYFFSAPMKTLRVTLKSQSSNTKSTEFWVLR